MNYDVCGKSMPWWFLACQYLILRLGYGGRAWNLNWPIRIQKAGQTVMSWRQCTLTGKALQLGNVWFRLSFNPKDGIIVSKPLSPSLPSFEPSWCLFLSILNSLNVCFGSKYRIWPSSRKLRHETPWVLTIYMGKPEIPVGKSNGSRHSVREASENMGCDLGWCYFSALISLSSWCGYTL